MPATSVRARADAPNRPILNRFCGVQITRQAGHISRPEPDPENSHSAYLQQRGDPNSSLKGKVTPKDEVRWMPGFSFYRAVRHAAGGSLKLAEAQMEPCTKAPPRLIPMS